MSIAKELAALYRRDLTRLIQQIEAYPNDEMVWHTHPAITNSAGNLVLHLKAICGNTLGVSWVTLLTAASESLNLAPREFRGKNWFDVSSS